MASKFERPVAGFTPSIGTENTTKYQDDSIIDTKISSQKVDGDINRVMDAANEIWLLTGGTGEANLSATLIFLDGAITANGVLISDNTAAIASLTAGTIPDQDYGDITVSASAQVWTIDAGVVTTSKLDSAPAASTNIFLQRNFT